MYVRTCAHIAWSELSCRTQRRHNYNNIWGWPVVTMHSVVINQCGHSHRPRLSQSLQMIRMRIEPPHVHTYMYMYVNLHLLVYMYNACVHVPNFGVQFGQIRTELTTYSRAVPSGGAGGGSCPPKNHRTFLRMRIIFV